MTWDQRVAIVALGVGVVLPWFLTSVTEALGIGVRRDR